MATADATKVVTAASRYATLESKRDPYLVRARDAAKLTIPSLMPPIGSSGTTEFPAPYQSMGARGVNNLASKLLLALLPPNSPFFRLNLGEDKAAEVDDNASLKAEVERALGVAERRVTQHIETSNLRVSMFEGLKQLVIAGNALVYLDDDGTMKVYRLDRFVVKRDPSGHMLEAVVKETITVGALPDAIRNSVMTLVRGEAGGETADEQTDVDIYTRVYLEGGQYNIYQEVKGVEIPGTDGHYPKDKCPWMALRMVRVDGEDYGRSHVEEHYGDLQSLEGLTKAIVDMAAAAAKIVMLVDPNGVTRAKDINDAESGDAIIGKEGDVTLLQLEKGQDFRIASETANKMETRLSHAFLMNTSIQRQAERVTAEEIRYMAGELEDALGGVYSILSQEFQLPLIRRLLFILTKKKTLPQFPKGMVEPSITTGLDALGRGHDLTKFRMWADQMVALFGPQVLAQVLDPTNTGNMIATQLAVDITGVVKSQDQLAQEKQAAQQADMVKTLAPHAMNATVSRENNSKDILLGQQQQQQGSGDGSVAAG